MELIKSEGIEGVTIRKLSLLAGVNVSLVNYYFGSKEKLISEAIKIQFDSFKEAFSVLEENESPPLARLKKFLLQYTSLMQEHPELIKKMLGQEILFQSKKEHKDFLRKQGFEKLSVVLEEITGESDRNNLYLMAQQVMCAVFAPMINATFQEEQDDADPFPSSIPIEKQINCLLDHYFYKHSSH